MFCYQSKDKMYSCFNQNIQDTVSELVWNKYKANILSLRFKKEEANVGNLRLLDIFYVAGNLPIYFIC